MVQPQEIDLKIQKLEAVKALKDGSISVQSTKMLGYGDNVQRHPEARFVIEVKNGDFSGLTYYKRSQNEAGGSEIVQTTNYFSGERPRDDDRDKNVYYDPLTDITGGTDITKPTDLIEILSQKLETDGYTASLDYHED